ncbi:hypothetical protein D3C84_723510 [compost metagenome]
MAIDKVRLQFTQRTALVADAVDVRIQLLMALAGGAIAAGADLAAVGTVQGEQLLGRGL